jgi:hypothetical protein
VPLTFPSCTVVIASAAARAPSAAAPAPLVSAPAAGFRRDQDPNERLYEDDASEGGPRGEYVDPFEGDADYEFEVDQYG